MTRVAIHQPNYLPWSGYFHKMALSDCFVLLDDAQFTKNGYQNRVKIKTPQGAQWLTQPVRLSDGAFKPTTEIAFANPKWADQHAKTIKANYARTRYFGEYGPRILETLAAASGLLAETNSRLIREIASILGIKARIVLASELGVKTSSTQRLVDIVKSLGGTRYVYGRGGVNYQDNALFTEAGISLTPANFTHPSHPQLWGEFAEGMSVIDLIFNCGPDSMKTLSG